MEKELLEMHKKHLENLMHEKGITSLKELDKDFIEVYTYDAISMEGTNNIPFEEVKRLIANGKIIGYSQREQIEVLNHVEAFNYIVNLLKTNNKDLTEEQVKDLHEIVVRDTILGGVYRNMNIQIVGASHQPPDYIKVYDRMKKLFSGEKTEGLSDFEKAIYVHGQIAKIHPFLDGNGRLARLVLNYYLMKAGYLPVSVNRSLRKEYFSSLENFKGTKETKILTDFIKSLLNKRYEILIEELEI